MEYRLEGEYITAAPDVIEWLEKLRPAKGGHGMALVFQGLPVYPAWAMPKGRWMRWKDGRPVDVGKIEAGEE